MKKMILPLTNWVFHVSVFILLYSNLDGTAYYENKLRDYFMMGVLILISGLINILPKFYKRPVKVSMKMLNKVTGKANCEYVLHDTGMDARTINMVIESKREAGLNSVLYRYLKNKNLYILIECNPKELHLQAKDESLIPEITTLLDGSGFMVDISGYFRDILKHSNEGNFAKKYQFFIKDPRELNEFYLNDTTVYINPILVLDRDRDKRAKLIEMLLNWSPQAYKIEYYRNEGK